MNGVLNFIEKEINESVESKLSLIQNKNSILKVGNECVKCLKKGNKIVFCGNGGSAADSQHLAAELIGYFSHKIKRKALPAIALTTNTSILTAISNDISFEQVFSRQIEGLVRRGDLVIAISTSGKSKNIINAINTANKLGAFTVLLTGKSAGKITKKVNAVISVNSTNTQRIQESHILIGHILCGIIELKIK